MTSTTAQLQTALAELGRRDAQLRRLQAEREAQTERITEQAARIAELEAELAQVMVSRDAKEARLEKVRKAAMGL